jgi:UPF0176 protein
MKKILNNYYITTFYQFIKLQDLPKIQKQFEEKALELNIKGLVILANEGFNSTCVSTSIDELDSWKKFIISHFQIPDLFFKDTESQKSPFRRFKVNIRQEIVTTGIPEMVPPQGKNFHLSPAEWNQVIAEESDYVLIDTRNNYEYRIGTFQDALNPNIEKFSEFPAYIEEQGISKSKKMLIFCTGGIRCEKGILELQKKGYENVHQLDGGILNYLKEYPNSNFKGECFVFDHRVALDQNLKPTSQYELCPHCGQPGDLQIICKRCDSKKLICNECSILEFKKETCSKNCAYHYKLHPDRKSVQQKVEF